MLAAYSPLSGETHLLNTTTVWLLEWLAEPGWHDPEDVLRRAAEDAEVPVDEIRTTVGDIWPSLVDLGLVLRKRAAAAQA